MGKFLLVLILLFTSIPSVESFAKEKKKKVYVAKAKKHAKAKKRKSYRKRYYIKYPVKANHRRTEDMKLLEMVSDIDE